MQNSPAASALIRQTYVTFAALWAAWTLTWALKALVLDARFGWLTTSLGGFVFWCAAKVLLWVLPALFLVGLSGRTLREVLNFGNWRSWLAWGGGVGFLIAITGFVPHALQGKPLLPTAFSIPLLNVLTVAPVLEEFLIRGAVFGNLLRGHSLRTANAASALLFVLLHMPGWYFTGNLAENMTRPVGGALSILVLGLLFGYAAYRGKSVAGAMIAHFLNRGYPSNRTGCRLRRWITPVLARTIRGPWASSRPGSEPMRTAWTTWSGYDGPQGSPARTAGTTEAGSLAMAGSCVPGAAAVPR